METTKIVEVCHSLRLWVCAEWWRVRIDAVEEGGGVVGLATLKQDLQADVGD